MNKFLNRHPILVSTLLVLVTLVLLVLCAKQHLEQQTARAVGNLELAPSAEYSDSYTGCDEEGCLRVP